MIPIPIPKLILILILKLIIMNIPIPYSILLCYTILFYGILKYQDTYLRAPDVPEPPTMALAVPCYYQARPGQARVG